jgi:hypothetical protein
MLLSDLTCESGKLSLLVCRRRWGRRGRGLVREEFGLHPIEKCLGIVTDDRRRPERVVERKASDGVRDLACVVTRGIPESQVQGIGLVARIVYRLECIRLRLPNPRVRSAQQPEQPHCQSRRWMLAD